jgi:hypothetical protein
MSINVAAAYDLLFPGLRKVAGDYKDLDRIYPKIYHVDKSFMSVERTASMRYLGLAALKNEGPPPSTIRLASATSTTSTTRKSASGTPSPAR